MRMTRKMTQYELADRTGMPQPNIARLEKEIKQGVELCTLHKLSIALGCDVVISGHSVNFVEKIVC
jgi:DNA-binding Xre family transcriptional regulator